MILEKRGHLINSQKHYCIDDFSVFIFFGRLLLMDLDPTQTLFLRGYQRIEQYKFSIDDPN